MTKPSDNSSDPFSMALAAAMRTISDDPALTVTHSVDPPDQRTA